MRQALVQREMSQYEIKLRRRSFVKLAKIVREEFRGNGPGRVHNHSTSFSNRHARSSTVIISDMVHALKF